MGKIVSNEHNPKNNSKGHNSKEGVKRINLTANNNKAAEPKKAIVIELFKKPKKGNYRSEEKWVQL